MDEEHDLITYSIQLAAIVAAAERERCCGIVFGMCGSDNVAQRTVDAIRARSQQQ